ncbi:probable Ephrin type-A receptor 5 at C-terminar half [Coccomyxa sp. Obi]|nr:probable Ephrin type-A receptor 5 at C-terminar half [Coccomyxa sp. Obi]
MTTRSDGRLLLFTNGGPRGRTFASTTGQGTASRTVLLTHRGEPMGQTCLALPHQDLSPGKPGAVDPWNISIDASALPPHQGGSFSESDGAPLNSEEAKSAASDGTDAAAAALPSLGCPVVAQVPTGQMTRDGSSSSGAPRPAVSSLSSRPSEPQSSSTGCSRGTPPLPGPPKTDSLARSGLPKSGSTATWRLPRNNSLDCPRLPGLAWGRLVGCGSFGRVYKGTWHDRRVAIKVLSTQGSKTRGFEVFSECLVAERVQHPNVVRTYKVLTVQQAGSQQPEPLQRLPFCRSASDGHCITPPCSNNLPVSSAVTTDDACEFFKGLTVNSEAHNALAVAIHGSATSKGAEASAFAFAASPIPEAGAFALAASSTPEASAFASVASVEPEASSPLANRCNSAFAEGNSLRGILDGNGMFMASRAATVAPLPSPFDAAVDRALSATADSEWGVVRRITRSFSADVDLAGSEARLPAAAAERGSCATSSLGSPAAAAELQSSWGGSSGGDSTMDEGVPPTCEAPQWWEDGRTLDGSKTLLVMEYADQRSLHTAISAGRLKGNLEAILLCAMDVAAGMRYLHSVDVVHADLKPANVLLKSVRRTPGDPRGFACKIADFGMARLISADGSHASTDEMGSLPYLAPETLQQGGLTKAADVYSYAILLLELWSGEAAYQDQNYHGVLYSVFSGHRPLMPADAPAPYRALIEDCWAADAKARPSFDDVITRLTALLADTRGNRPV